MGLMGMFDDIQWPDGRRAQVKCLGCEMKLFTKGDTVHLMPTPRAGTVPEADVAPDSFQIAVNDGSFLTVRHGRLTEWDRRRQSGLTVLDNRGTTWSGDPATGAVLIPPVVE